MTIHYDHHIEARKLGIVVLEKLKNEALAIDIALPRNKRLGEKEIEMVKKYQEPKMETKSSWRVKKVEVIPVVVVVFE